jgi:hypothetical protein
LPHRLLSRTRALLYTGGALTVLACAALCAVPGQTPVAQTVAATKAPPAVPNVNGLMVFPNVRVENAPPAEQPASASGQRAFIDPVTRQLREPTPEEVLELQQAGVARTRTFGPAVAQATITKAPDGSDMAILGTDYMVFTVAAPDASGKVSVNHAAGPKEAAARMTTKAPAKNGKEAGHDR